MSTHRIEIQVRLDAEKVPEKIEWKSRAQGEAQESKAFLLSLWDAREKTAMRLDLWVKDMPIHEMGDFFFQTLLTLGNTYAKAVPDSNLHTELKAFAHDFYRKFKAERTQKEGA